LNQAVFLEAAGAVLKIGLSLILNHHWEILLAQIRETLCSKTGDFKITGDVYYTKESLLAFCLMTYFFNYTNKTK